MLTLAYLLLVPFRWPTLPWGVQACDVVLVGLLVALCWVDDDTRLRGHPLDVLVVVWIVGSVLAIGDPRSLVALAKDASGLLVYFVFALVVATEHRRWVIGALAGSAVLTAWLALGGVMAGAGQTSTLPWLGTVPRTAWPFHSPEMLACFLALALPFLILFGRVWPCPLATLGAVALAFTATFAHALAGLYVGLAWLLPRGRKWALASALVVVLVVNALLVVSPSRTHYQMPNGLMSYAVLKQLAVEAWWTSPVVGIGLGTFHDVTRQAVQEGRMPPGWEAVDPHSTWFGRLAETGLLGFATLAALWVGVLRLIAKPGPDPGLHRAVAAGLLALLVASVNIDVMHFRFLWVGLALLRSTSGIAAPQTTPR